MNCIFPLFKIQINYVTEKRLPFDKNKLFYGGKYIVQAVMEQNQKLNYPWKSSMLLHEKKKKKKEHPIVFSRFLMLSNLFCLLPLILFLLGGGKCIKLFRKEAVKILSVCKVEKVITMHDVILGSSAKQLKSNLTKSLSCFFGVTHSKGLSPA